MMLTEWLPPAEVKARANWHGRTTVVTQGPDTARRIKEYQAIRELLVRLRQQDTPVWQGE